MAKNTLFTLVGIGLILLTTACGGGGSGGTNFVPPVGLFTPLPSSSGNPVAGLGNLATEVNYVQTTGNGNVTIITDASAMDFQATLGAGGQQLIIQPTGPVLDEVRTWFIYHEFAHHYLNHLATAPDPTWGKEFAADAFATRVMFQLNGSGDLGVVRNYFQTSGSQGDPTHAPHSLRATYLDDVLAAVQSNPTNVPTPPVNSGMTIQNGAIQVFNNSVLEGLAISINGIPQGILQLGQFGTTPLPPGQYQVLAQGLFSLQFAIQIVIVQPNQTTQIGF